MQQKTKTTVSRPKRWLSLLLAIVTVISLLPAMALPAMAATAPPTVSLVNVDGSPPSYTSTSGLRTVYIQPFTVNAGGATVTAFCADHARHIGPSAVGNTWNLDSSKSVSPLALPFLDWYYAHERNSTKMEADNPSLGEAELSAKYGPAYWSAWARRLASNLPRVAVWLANNGTLTSLSNSSQLDILAKEYRTAYAAVGGSMTQETAREIIDGILSEWNSGAIAKNNYSIYQHSTNSGYYQPILVPISKSLNNYPVYLKLKKTENEQPLANCVFEIFEDSLCQKSLGQIDTASVEWSISEVIRLNIPTTTLYVKEVYAPSGYTIDDTVYPVSVDASKHSTEATAAAVNNGAPIVNGTTTVRDGQFKIIKLSAGTTKGLAGAIFDVYFNAAKIGSYATDSSGVVVVEGIRAGTWTIVERVPPANHLLSANHTQTISITQKDIDDEIPITVTFENAPFGSLLVEKRSTPSNSKVKDAVFLVREVATGYEFTMTTDASGTAFRDRLPLGAYEIRELSVPDTVILDVTPQTVSVVSGKTSSTTFVNQEKVGLIIYKYDETTKTPLKDIVFEVYKDAMLLGTYKTDGFGQIRLTNLDFGTYLAKEISSDSTHVLNSTPQQIELTAGSGTKELVFLNKLKPGMWLVKLDSQTMQPISGVKFRIEKVGGTYNQEHTTNAQGEIDLSALEPGTYQVTELVAEGYVMDDASRIIQLNAGERAQFVFTNTKLPTLEIVKTSKKENTPISGVSFLVKEVEGGTVTTVMTGADGKATVPNLMPGVVYSVSEQSVPEPWILDTTPQLVTLEAGKTTTLKFENERKPNLLIVKQDSITGDRIPQTKFQLFMYDAEGGKTDLGIFYTDEHGEIKLENLPECRIEAIELEPVHGYAIKGNGTQEIYLKGDEDKTLYFDNVPLSAIIVKKLNTDASPLPLPGMVFQVRYLGGDQSGSGGTMIGEYTTTENGTYVITGLKRGYYIIEEKIPPAGHALSAESIQTVFVSGNDQDIITVTFRNQRNPGFLLLKRDASDKSTPLGGVLFKITDSSGKAIGDNGGIFETDTNGTISIPDLPPNTTLLVQEIQAKDGYVLDGTVHTAKLNANSVYEMVLYNERLGGLLLVKRGSIGNELLSGVQYKITYADGSVVGNNNGIFTTDRNGEIRIEESFASGMTLLITEVKAKDGYLLDSTVHSIQIKESGKLHTLTLYNKPIGGLQILKLDEQSRRPIAGVEFAIARMNGERIGTYTTDKNGQIFIPNIGSGWFTATETKAAKGYLLDSTPHNIEVQDGQTAVLTITNKMASGIFIRKIDSITKKGIAGVTFLLYDSRKNPIGEYVSNQDGYVFIDEGLPEGRYYMRELKADGYIVDEALKTIDIRYGSTVEIIWENTPIRGQIQVIKKSADDNPTNGLPAGTLLEGAVFEVYDKAGNLVDTIVTGRDGRAVSRLLPLSRYTIREVKAPAYYSASDTVMTAYLEHEGQIVTFEVLNKSATTGVNITKTGYAEVMSNQPIKYTFSGIANTSSVPLNSFYWRDTLPAQMELTQIVTGTYNQALSYKIVYKTNLSTAYLTLADNLSTSRNYALDASPAALGLAANERVTEVMFVFGTVKAGFAQVETPFIHGQTVSGLVGGSEFVNVADVGGQHNGQWIMGMSRWVTKVYGKTTAPTLPKTGF